MALWLKILIGMGLGAAIGGTVGYINKCAERQ